MTIHRIKNITVRYSHLIPTELTHLLAKGTKMPRVNTVSIGPMKAELKILIIARTNVPATCGISDVSILSTPNTAANKQQQHLHKCI